jgi:hypothetical protein
LPVTSIIDVGRLLVLTRLIGAVTEQEVEDHNQSLRRDPLFNPRFRQLVDLSELTEILFDSAAVEVTSREHVFAPGVRRAIVASSDAVFGMSRMFATQSESVGQTIHVFRDMDSANAWLGL